MEIVRGIDNYISDSDACLTIGTFDGLHIGHQQILSTLKGIAVKENLRSVVITFDPHPRQILMPGAKLDFVLSQQEKVEAFRNIGVDCLIIHPFSLDFASLTAERFLVSMRDRLNMRHLVKGFNNHFGKDRLSDLNVIREIGVKYGFRVTEVQKMSLDGISASSTEVRRLVSEGCVDKAAEILGYRFMLTGSVVHGRHIGTSLGFPTANIYISDPNKIIPKAGVYKAVSVLNGKEYPVMLNIGSNPTVNPDSSKTYLEAHIIGFQGDIYGQQLTVSLLRRIRDERQFSSLNELKEQLQRDMQEIDE